MSSLEALQAETLAAKAAYKANKADKSLKEAYKAKKLELEQATAAAEVEKEQKKKKKKKRKQADADENESERPTKRAKTETVTLASLTEAAQAAKLAYKSNKADPSLKTLYKEAKARLQEFEAAQTQEAPEQESKAAAEAEEEAEGGEEEEEAYEEQQQQEEEEEEGVTEEKVVPRPVRHAKDINDPEACEKIFIGNIAFNADEAEILALFDGIGTIIDHKWLDDKNTGKFAGRGFISFDSIASAAQACQTIDGTKLKGRTLRCNFAPDKIPRVKKQQDSSRFANQPLSEKPEGTQTVFCGNLSFDIDEATMHDFAKDSGEIAAIRWLSHKDSGDFKGCAFVEFTTTEAVDEFVKLNGERLMGRPIRIDYAESNK